VKNCRKGGGRIHRLRLLRFIIAINKKDSRRGKDPSTGPYTKIEGLGVGMNPTLEVTRMVWLSSEKLLKFCFAWGRGNGHDFWGGTRVPRGFWGVWGGRRGEIETCRVV